MPVDYEILEGGVLLVRASGVVTRDEAEAVQRRMATDTANGPTTPDLVDLSEVEGTDIARRDLHYLAGLVTRLEDPPKTARCAFVVKSDLLYGLTRQYRASRARAAREMETFRDRSEAMRWLAGETD